MNLRYETVRSSRRTAAIHIYPGGRIVVRVPRRFPETRIQALLRDRAPWIERKHRELLHAQDLSTRAVTNAMRERARNLLAERLVLLLTGTPGIDLTPLRLDELGYSQENPPLLRIRKMKRRWGSCSATGVITLNVHLADRPVEQIDYVIVHELCHLRELNHSRQFYALLEAAMPSWRTLRHQLNH